MVTFVFLGDQLKQLSKLFHSTGLARFLVFWLGLKTSTGRAHFRVFRLGLKTSTGRAHFLVFRLALKHFAFGFSGSGTNSSLNYSYPLTVLIIRSNYSCDGGFCCFIIAVYNDLDDAFCIFNRTWYEW